MPRIRQLPPEVVTKIAAGEVIERPASVVKELLENSVDAGSTRIDVELEQGGSELIRVVDNGSGINSDDLPLTFASHATSKLSTAEDLFRVHTMGFRGEALASIGGVSQALIQARVPGQASGAEISCHGGEISSIRPWNGAPGTRIEVRHLFFNTPVRRKFMRSTATEMGHISEIFTRLALAHTGIHFTLRHNNKAVYEVPATDTILERIRVFFGTDVSDQLYAIEARQENAILSGFIADPACDRGTAKMQYLFLNGRWIRDRSLSHALQEGYRGLMMTGRYPVAFVFLRLPAEEVDVNVHPTKVEVRFRNGQALHHLVHMAVRERLSKEKLTARLQHPVPAALSAPVSFPPAADWPRSTELFVARSAPHVETSSSPVAPANGPSVALTSGGEMVQWEQGQDHEPVRSEPPATPSASVHPMPGLASTGNKVVQLYDTYLVMETDEGMLVIDQHALHERILFEQLKDRLARGALEIQRLLIPQPVDLSAEQAGRVLEHAAELGELGLLVEDFGGNTVLLTGYPAILGDRSPEGMLQRVVDYLSGKDRLPSREALLTQVLSLMACHAAVRAGDRLTREQIDALVCRRDLVHDVHHCPHGRPTALLFSRQELERQFGRI